jgi:hypothetical protein
MPEAPRANWHDAFPAPERKAGLLTRHAALPSLSSPDLLLVDVRRTDYEGGTIRGSINLPAQSFYVNTAVLHDLCKRAGVKQVAFYCGTYVIMLYHVHPRAPSRSRQRPCFVTYDLCPRWVHHGVASHVARAYCGGLG